MSNDDLIRHLVDIKALKNQDIINAFKLVDRKDFVSKEFSKYAYIDEPLPIGRGQTISQPFTIANMIEALEPNKGQKILEIGTGSGYQTAILSKIIKSGKIVTIEIDPILYEKAKEKLKDYKNVIQIIGDGSIGYKTEAPYDRIIVSCESPSLQKEFVEQLKNGGIIVIPIGKELWKFVKNGKLKKKYLGLYSFVPMRGEKGYR